MKIPRKLHGQAVKPVPMFFIGRPFIGIRVCHFKRHYFLVSFWESL